MNLFKTESERYVNVEYDVPEFILTAIFNDDVSGLSQQEANASLAFMYQTIQELRKQDHCFCHWAVLDQDQKPAFRKYHDMNNLGIDAANCVTIVAVCLPMAD